MAAAITAPAPAGSPPAWTRQLRPALDAIHDDVPRAILIGNAGSGKSTGIRCLHDMLSRASRTATVLTAPRARLDTVPPSHVLLVDDLQLWQDDAILALHERAQDPDAALIVAGRPWPASPLVQDLRRTLERRAPLIVLGHVLRSDVLELGAGAALDDRCLDHILDVTGGVSWLVTEALRRHDARDCRGGCDHSALDRALTEVVAHRIDAAGPDLRLALEAACAAPPGRAVPSAAADQDSPSDEWTLRGYAEGLVLRNGEAVPLVRSAVRAAMPLRRLIEIAAGAADPLWDAEQDEPLLDGVNDRRIAEVLVAQADDLLDRDPARAGRLYAHAAAAGASPASLAVRRANAAWAMGDPDAAASIAEASLDADDVDTGALVDVTAAVWASRAMMSRADALRRIAQPSGVAQVVDTVISSLGVGSTAALDLPMPAELLPSSLTVALELLRRGLATSVSAQGDGSELTDLVRAAELYTTAGASGAVCELPAVIAAITAINLGRLSTARTIIDDAIAGTHGGAWAQPRLLLWRAWIAVQQARPGDARAALGEAESATTRSTARDELLAHAVRIALARRSSDAATLEATWKAASGILLRTEIDLYLLHPLSEYVSAAARVGEAECVQPHLRRAREITAQLGDPALWSSPVLWAAVQQGILLSRPEQLAPFARALVAASRHSRVAAGMSRAGRVWTSVLAGTVDEQAVVAAADGLAAVGLLWDAARLAGHGAARTSDRRVAARLLARARELHPSEGSPRGTAVATETTPGAQRTPDEQLSERETEVARLVLQGKTYAEIGDAIFISPRTVEHHIAHIRRRLGATSRSEVLAKLRVILGEDGR